MLTSPMGPDGDDVGGGGGGLHRGGDREGFMLTSPVCLTSNCSRMGSRPAPCSIQHIQPPATIGDWGLADAGAATPLLYAGFAKK